MCTVGLLGGRGEGERGVCGILSGCIRFVVRSSLIYCLSPGSLPQSKPGDGSACAAAH